MVTVDATALMFLLALATVSGCIGPRANAIEEEVPAASERRDEGESPPDRATANTTVLPPEGPADPARTQPTPPDVKRFDGSAAGQANPSFYSPLVPNEKYHPSFEVRDGATWVVFEAAWDGGEKLDFYPMVPEPDCHSNDPVFGECSQPSPRKGTSSPVKIEVSTREFLTHPGPWEVRVYAPSATTDVAFRSASSVFYGAPPPEAYSALEPR
jgi:hypothetical protein